MTHPDAPYKGLKYYTSDDAAIFAARDKDAGRCARLLSGRASVLMLHGRTGCGKSSFLRAALKPLLKTASTGLWFPGAADQFSVVRSGLAPLQEIARALYDLVDGLFKSDPDREPELRAVLGECRSRDEFVASRGTSSELLVQSLSLLGEAAPGTPIIVVDQAEEIFTLREVERQLRDAATQEDVNKVKARIDEVTRARVAYMNVLRIAASRPLGIKFLISLRTEYKGLFEDELRAGISSDTGISLAGFHLDDLDFAGLVKAIEKPERLGAASEESFGVYKFKYAPGVAERIAERLTNPEAVPMGGVLPTLQVVCSRLYEQTKQSRADEQATWTIRMTDLERLGNLDNQIEVYLREQLEEMFVSLRPAASATTRYAEEDRTKHIDQWYRLLEKLVRVQGDGRAVTKQSPVEIVEADAKNLDCQLVEEGLPHLVKVGILRSDQDGKSYSLGHDSLGLAIQKWSVTYKDVISPTMAMDMNSPREAAKLTALDLFPQNAAPAEFTVIVPRDLLWDHQIPYFAAARQLTDRLGIHFVSQPDLEVANSKDAKTQQNQQRAAHWGELCGRILQQNAADTRLLVASERVTFPPRREDASLWTDVAVSDLFLGNGVVGPVIHGLSPLRQSVSDIADSKRIEAMRPRLAAIIRHLVDKRARLISYDDTAESMIELAAALARVHLPKKAIKFDKERDPQYTGDDELFARLVDAGNDHGVFMVGTAYGRALASHQGYVTYFDCKDLKVLLDAEMADQSGGLWNTSADDRVDLFKKYQESVFHTIWQLNVPRTEWRRIENYPLVMRLAGACYFTADYIRSFADDFVRHLYDWHAHNFESAARASRETTREVLRDCFLFLAFEENPRLLFDPDSLFEFSPKDSEGALPSTVREIHIELIRLRKRTVDTFNAICNQLDQLERLHVNSRVEPTLRKAEALRTFAWKNSRIYNFYDSARLMRQASDCIEEVVDRATRDVWQRTAQGSDSLDATVSTLE